MRARTIACVCLGLGVSVWNGCGGGSAPVRGEPLAVSADWNRPVDERVEAVRASWERAVSGEADRQVTRSALEALAWDLETPELVRGAALECVLWDEQAEPASIELVQGMLPTEPGRHAVAVMATAAADHGWTETTAALVRSLGRPIEGLDLHERSEFQALELLYPDHHIASVVFGVFLDPQTDAGPGGLRLDMRAREGAWGLLSQLEPSTAERAAMLASGTAVGSESAEVVGALRSLHQSFGVLPSTAEETRWAVRLTGPAHDAWWAEAAPRVRASGAAETLHHLEPVRWASERRPAWAADGRDSLLDALADRLSSRTVYARQKSVAGTPTANAERLSAQRASISRGDALTLLVLDETHRDPGVVAALFDGVDRDHEDRTTEHGGILVDAGGRLGVEPFVPRGGRDDRRFVAPRGMIERSDTALAHYHFHASSRRNRDYAGPSGADVEYAARFGRACLVITSLSSDRLNVDVVLPSGVVVDLGVIERPDTGR